MKRESYPGVLRKTLVMSSALGVTLLMGAEGCEQQPSNPPSNQQQNPPAAKQAKPKGGELVTGCKGYRLEDKGGFNLHVHAEAITQSGRPPTKSDVNLWIPPDVNVRGTFASPVTRNPKEITDVKVELENRNGKKFECAFLGWKGGRRPQALGNVSTAPQVESVALPLPDSQPTPTDMPTFYASPASPLEQVDQPVVVLQQVA